MSFQMHRTLPLIFLCGFLMVFEFLRPAPISAQVNILYQGLNEPSGTPVVAGSGLIYGASYGTPGCIPDTILCGFVFALSKGPGTSFTTHILHTFDGDQDGAGPSGGLIGYNGVLYGTTTLGGQTGNGIVFSITPALGNAYAVLYNFYYLPDGSSPTYLTILNGTLYGITNFGGTNDEGEAFSLTPPASGIGPWIETVIYNFDGGGVGAIPQYIAAHDGSLFVSLSNGGKYNGGSVVKLSGETGASWSATVLHAFNPAGGGYNPEGFAFGPDGNIYGVTTEGGAGACSYQGLHGCGVVYQLITSSLKYQPIYTFRGGADAGAPFAPPTFYQGMNMVLPATGYGVVPSSNGAVLTLTSSGGRFTTTVLHTFTSGEGSDPASRIVRGPNGIYYSFGSLGQWGMDPQTGFAYSVTLR